MNTPSLNAVQPVSAAPAMAPVGTGNIIGALALVILLMAAIAGSPAAVASLREW